MTHVAMTAETLGERIRARRDYLGLTQQELADAFGCARETISNWEHGRRGIDAIDLIRLARILDVDLAYFDAEFQDPVESESVIREAVAALDEATRRVKSLRIPVDRRNGHTNENGAGDECDSEIVQTG